MPLALPESARLSRRTLLQGLGAVALGTTAGTVAHGFLYERHHIELTEQTLDVAGWPSSLAGFRIGFLTDLHRSTTVSHQMIAGAVDLVMAHHPDIIVVGGDYVTNRDHRFVQPAAEALARLSAPFGVFAVLGNHDWWNDGERTRRAFTAQGIHVLEEQATRVEHNGAAFYIVGLADQMERASNPRAALALAAPGVPTLLLVHEPDVFASFPQLGLSPTLTLAGHTHGGQVWLPLLGRRVVPSRFGERYAHGHVVENERHLFVTAGVGTSIFPVRFLVPPEIALLTLR